MHDGDDSPEPHTDTDPELDHFEAGLDTVEAALAALDHDDLPQAESLVASLDEPADAAGTVDD